MKSDYFIVSIKVCPEVVNDEYIILRTFGGRSVSGFEDIEGSFWTPPVAESKRIGFIEARKMWFVRELC